MFSRVVYGLCAMTVGASVAPAKEEAEHVYNAGSRPELFTDDWLICQLSGGARLRLHQPQPQEAALVCDAPWEGNACGYITVIRDTDRYRMYYRGAHMRVTPTEYTEAHPMVYCYAESTDGVHWVRPVLRLVEFGGSTENNIILDERFGHSFAPFKDENPECPPEAKYKALANGTAGHGLYALKSPDGIHWTLMSDKPVITDGALDSQNLAFWDVERKEYRAYYRDFRQGRDIKTATSRDFINWTPGTWLVYCPGRI
ncbi:MAG: hypothetical protein H5T86_06105, partial [Armatimonadetes bacterium]|nr:hypothetical protein [Armatimonadota bacterium]